MHTSENGTAFTSLFRVAIATLFTAGTASRADATLGIVAYYASTGNLVVEKSLPVSQISGLVIKGPAPFALPPDDFGGLVDTWENEVGWLLFTPVQAPLQVNSILPAGLTSTELQKSYSVFVYIPAGDYEPYPPADWRYVPVPEPSSALLCGLSGVATMLTARRRVS